MIKKKKLSLNEQAINSLHLTEAALNHASTNLPPKRYEKWAREFIARQKKYLSNVVDEAGRWKQFNQLKERCEQNNINIRKIIRELGYNESLIGLANMGKEILSRPLLDKIATYLDENNIP